MDEKERRIFVYLCEALKEKGLIDDEEERAFKIRLNREEMGNQLYGKSGNL